MSTDANDPFVYPAAADDEPLVGDPIVEARFVHHQFKPGTITIVDEKEPRAWITSTYAVEFGGGA